jgi:hypothetical protein
MALTNVLEKFGQIYTVTVGFVGLFRTTKDAAE